MADLKPKVVFVNDGQEITQRQMQAFVALSEKGSMKKAADALGVSTPVLYKYIREVEDRADSALVSSTSKGSTLTPAGRELLARFKAYERRLEDDKTLRVAGTVVSERCVLAAATELSDDGIPCKVVIATDEDNLRLMDEHRVDCVLVDDAVFAMERASETPTSEIGSDLLLQRDQGQRYAELSFGAQRLAFRYLKEKQIPYEIVRRIMEPTFVDRTDLSYFINRSLVRTGIVKAEGAKDQRWSIHSIMALQCSEHDDLPRFLEEAREAWVYHKG